MIHFVRQGDCLHSIAAQYGFSSWKPIYEHADNAALRQRRPNPDLLHPGDAVVIPDRVAKYVERATNARHVLRVKRPPVALRVYLRDEEGEPLARTRYVVRAKGIEQAGRTDADGLVEQTVPADLASVELLVWLDDDGSDQPDLEYTLMLGHLDPIETFTGVRERLYNLGYPCGDAEEGSDAIRDAVRAFRRDHGLAEGDEIDAEFHSRLRAVHDRG